VKLGSDTAIVASASQCGRRVTCKSSCGPRSNLSLRPWCRGRHVFGCSKEFCPNYPFLPETNPTNVTSKKKLFNFGANCFQIIASWRHFCSNFQGVDEGFHRLCPNFGFQKLCQQHFGMAKLRSECCELIAKCEMSADAINHNLQNVEVIAKSHQDHQGAQRHQLWAFQFGVSISGNSRLWFDSRLRQSACKPMTRSDLTILVTRLDQVMTLILNQHEKILDDSSSVVVNLFCIGTHFQIITKTCTPLPCTKIYYCKSAKFLCCRRCLADFKR